MATLKIKFVHEIPQITAIGERIMATLANITAALDTLSSVLDVELTQIADALANMTGPTQEEVDLVAQRVSDLKDRIANIVP